MLTVAVSLLATSALADPAANPYSACIAEAGPIYGSVMTIENLRQYMAEHPDCVPPALRSTEKYRQQAATPTPKPTSETIIHIKCQSDWPDDFRMRKYCKDIQRKAVNTLAEGVAVNIPADLAAIVRSKCEQDWPDDFQMQLYCQESQFKAIRLLEMRSGGRKL
jgi:hypothetical protein